MNTYFLALINVDIKIYLFIFLPMASLALLYLLKLLKSLVNQQVDEQVKQFAIEAKIPKNLIKLIGVKIRWR